MDSLPETAPSTPRVLFWVPLPPPYGGPEVASELLVRETVRWFPRSTVASATLRTTNLGKGKLDLPGVLAFIRVFVRYLRALAGSRCRLVYLSLSPNRVGFLRDLALLWTAWACGKRIVAHLRGSNFDNFYQSSSRLFRSLIRATWGRIDRAIVQSPRLTSQLGRAAPRVPVSVLPNGLPAMAAAGRRSNHPSGRVTLLFMGYLTYTKGFYDLLRVVRTLNGTAPLVRFRFAGERPPGDLRQFGAFLPPGLRADYLGRAEAIAAETNQFIDAAPRFGAEYLGVISGTAKDEAFRTADIFVLPSYAEGFSVAVLEAMMSGLPIVTTPVGALPDVLKDGVNGFFVPPGDLGALESKLRTLIGDSDLREQMGQANQRKARELYSIEKVSCGLRDILLEASRLRAPFGRSAAGPGPDAITVTNLRAGERR